MLINAPTSAGRMPFTEVSPYRHVGYPKLDPERAASGQLDYRKVTASRTVPARACVPTHMTVAPCSATTNHSATERSGVASDCDPKSPTIVVTRDRPSS